MKTIISTTLVAIAAAIILMAGSAGAQTYSIEWQSINSGGGEMSSDTYTMNGSVGQSAAGYVSNEGYQHWVGFWLATGHSVFGTINLGNYSGDFTAVPISVELRAQDGPTTQQYIYLEPDKTFTLDDIEPGTYDIAFKASHWLRSVLWGVQIGE